MEQKELYNLYIKVGEKRQTVTAVDKDDINKLFDGIRQGKEKVLVAGKYIYISYDVFKIYDVRYADNKTDKGLLKSEVNRNAIKYTLKGVKNFQSLGIDVTDDFDVPDRLDVPEEGKNTGLKQRMIKHKVFVSHSSKDEKIIKSFVKEILLIGFGLKPDDIFCTSIEGSNIKSGEDFKKRIKKEMLSAKLVIQLITPNYKTSEVCLNEMGAAWVLHDKVIPFVLSGSYDVGFIHSSTQQLRLDNLSDLTQFYDDVKVELGIENIQLAVLQRAFTDFIKEVNRIKEQREAKTEKKDYFFDEPVELEGVFNYEMWEHSNGIYHRCDYIQLAEKINVYNIEITIEDEIGYYPLFEIDKIQIWGYIDEMDKEVPEECINKKVRIKGKYISGESSPYYRTQGLAISLESITVV